MSNAHRGASLKGEIDCNASGSEREAGILRGMKITMRDLAWLNVAEMEKYFRNESQDAEQPDDGERGLSDDRRDSDGQRYEERTKEEKGTIRRYLPRVTGRSRAQFERLIGRRKKERKVDLRAAKRPEFSKRRTKEDAAMLAEVDAPHEDLSGPAVRRLLVRAMEASGDSRLQRLATISTSHLYNLRKSKAHRSERVRVEPTQSRRIAIGERRRADPRNQPGYMRIDTVHQGDHDGKHGVYHFNAVDTVTQRQVLGCVETTAERHLIPVLESSPVCAIALPSKPAPSPMLAGLPPAPDRIGGFLVRIRSSKRPGRSSRHTLSASPLVSLARSSVMFGPATAGPRLMLFLIKLPRNIQPYCIPCDAEDWIAGVFATEGDPTLMLYPFI